MFLLVRVSKNSLFSKGDVYYLFAETLEDFIETVKGYSDDEWFISGAKIDPTDCGIISEELLPILSIFNMSIKDWVEDKMSKINNSPRCVIIPVSLA